MSRGACYRSVPQGEIGLYRAGWNCAMRGKRPTSLSFAYRLGYRDAKRLNHD
jgi:hypothetical protein